MRFLFLFLQDTGVGQTELKEGVAVKSRDIGSLISTPTKRRHKKKLDAASGQTSSSSETQTQITEAPSGMTFKFILGVALVSVIIGVILGKRY